MAFLHATVELVAILLFTAVLTRADTLPDLPRVALAQLKSQTNQGLSGGITFTDLQNGTIFVSGIIMGLPPGSYGFHIHELGVVTTCDFTGEHFNPHGQDHGGRDHTVRHVGDFGNVKFEVIGGVSTAVVSFGDSFIKFSGENNILGRSLVLHRDEDDLGKGDHPLSPVTGNAGPRIACGIIGIQSGNWNSAISTYSSASLVIFGILFLFLP